MKERKDYFEEVLEQVLALQEKGRTREEILALLPEQKNELAEISAVMAELEKAKGKIAPPRALLEKIVAKTELAATGAEQLYNKQGVGRLSFINILINKNFNLLNWRIIAPIGVVALVFTVFALAQTLPGENKGMLKIAKQTPAVVQNESAESAVSAPEAGEKDVESESIDSIINSLLDDLISEQAIAAEEDADASLLAADSQEIDNFSQIYDEKEF